MFNRGLFDKTSFNSVDISDDDNIAINLYGNGPIGTFPLEISIPLPGSSLFGDSDFELIPYIEEYFTIALSESWGDLEMYPVLDLPLDIDITSGSDLEIFRLGDTDISLLDLKNISLMPGETITIDTDLMIVLFGLEHDVSSLTNNSEFFELGKGLNEITFMAYYVNPPNPRNDEELDVIVIWENRWL